MTARSIVGGQEERCARSWRLGLRSKRCLRKAINGRKTWYPAIAPASSCWSAVFYGGQKFAASRATNSISRLSLAIALDKATDELVKVFGEDEERSRPNGRKAAIG